MSQDELHEIPEKCEQEDYSLLLPEEDIVSDEECRKIKKHKSLNIVSEISKLDKKKKKLLRAQKIESGEIIVKERGDCPQLGYFRQCIIDVTGKGTVPKKEIKNEQGELVSNPVYEQVMQAFRKFYPEKKSSDLPPKDLVLKRRRAKFDIDAHELKELVKKVAIEMMELNKSV